MIIITANFGGYDDVRPLPAGLTGILCTDDGDTVDGWVSLVLSTNDPRRSARHEKIRADWAGVEYVLWMDGQFHLASDPGDWVRGMLANDELALFAHPSRTCAYAEARACVAQGRGDPKAIAEQVERFRSAGLPENYGLFATGIMLWRNTDRISELRALWWEEETSRRDQISLPYCLWKLGIKPRVIAGDVYKHPVVRWHGHR